MTAEAYLDLMKRLGLTPVPGMGTSSNWLCKTRDGDYKLVRKPFDLTEDERAAEAQNLSFGVNPFDALQ